MKVAVLGAGVVGITTAYELAQDGHDVTVIDQDAALVRKITETLDVRGVHGLA